MNPVSLEPGFEWSPIVRLYRTDLFLGQPGASVRGNPVVEGRSGNPHQHQKKMPTDPVRRSIVFVDDLHYTEAENTLGGRTGFWINYFFFGWYENPQISTNCESPTIGGDSACPPGPTLR